MPGKKLQWLLCSAVLLSLAVAPSDLQGRSDLEQHLRDQYRGRTLVLRNFYAGGFLRYDASGQLSRSAASGDWTADAVVQVDDVKISSSRLTIQARRQHMGWLHDAGFSPVPGPAGKAGKEYEESKRLRIEADLTPGEVTAGNVEAALAGIFLTSQDHFGDLVPDYWKPCVLAGLTGKDLQNYTGCRLSADFLAIPGVAYAQEQKTEAAASESVPERLFQVGKGMTAPRLTYNREPEFSLQARGAKYQGTVVLMLVVDQTGATRDLRIVRPLGCGLDRRAVETVATWKFNPATKDGKPVAVQIAVEVDFHLY